MTGYGAIAYATSSYATSLISVALASQIHAKIIDNYSAKSQIESSVVKNSSTHSQIDSSIGSSKSVDSQVVSLIKYDSILLSQIEVRSNKENSLKSEVRLGRLRHRSVGFSNADYASYSYLSSSFSVDTRSQIEALLINTPPKLTQVESIINRTNSLKSEIRRGKLRHRVVGYSNAGYAAEHYLSSSFSVDLGSQIDALILAQSKIQSQIESNIDRRERLKTRLESVIFRDRALRSQVNLARRALLKSQIQAVLYNTRNLRVLVDFANRGTSDGLNWTSNSSASGDFSVNNLNTDIVEQVWRGSILMKTGIDLRCDTQVSQGVFVDTLAILSHNLTSSASIVWQASNDSNFATVGFNETLLSTKNNVYYIAAMLPNASYRYHRFLIDDVTNPNDSLQIGAILFGSSVILQSENFTDQVTRKTTHYSDKINTEAFTNVSNDRASKTSVGLEFRNLELNRGNYASLSSVFDEVRTSIKALWIPTPRYASRYAVFGKLVELPQESHNDLGEGQDYVSFSLTIDEAL